jgi:hypothetical protein
MRCELQKLINEFNNTDEPYRRQEHAEKYIKQAFELGLKLGKEPRKKKFKRPAGHPKDCLCELCFAPVHETARKL